jgi:hypothetical protein
MRTPPSDGGAGEAEDLSALVSLAGWMKSGLWALTLKRIVLFWLCEKVSPEQPEGSLR